MTKYRSDAQYCFNIQWLWMMLVEILPKNLGYILCFELAQESCVSNLYHNKLKYLWNWTLLLIQVLQITRLEPYSSLPVAQFWVSSSLLNQMAAQLKYLRLVITTLAEHRTHDLDFSGEASERWAGRRRGHHRGIPEVQVRIPATRLLRTGECSKTSISKLSSWWAPLVVFCWIYLEVLGSIPATSKSFSRVVAFRKIIE